MPAPAAAYNRYLNAHAEFEKNGATAFERIDGVSKMFPRLDAFYQQVLDKDLILLSAEKLSDNTARATWEFYADPFYCQLAGNVHGGFHATVFDMCTTMVIPAVSRPGFWLMLGVTRNLNVTYLRPAPKGETFLVECEIVSLGKNVALLKGEMRRKKDGAIVSTCLHDKVSTDAVALAQIKAAQSKL